MIWVRKCWTSDGGSDSGLLFHNSPRKFLAPDELKTMLAHILMSYNVEFETEPPGQQAFTGNLNVIADRFVYVPARRILESS